MSEVTAKGSHWFQRFVLPGFAFKAVVIGGGYATGRELAEFFLPSGPWGGVLGMVLAAVIWSIVAALTFVFARRTGSLDYRHFFRRLLGPFWFVFEIAFVLMLIILLAVFGAAAGALGHALLGLPVITGTLVLVAGIAGFTALGNHSVEELFKYVSFLLYGVYAVFLLLALTTFGGKIGVAFEKPALGSNWIVGGLTYSGYNIIGAVAILPVLRHMRSDRDAVVAGLLAGPLAMAPALLFFVCMAAWPDVKGVALPSDFLLGKLNMPIVRWAFQIMIFAALLESGTGSVNAFIERVAGVFAERGGHMPSRLRLFFCSGALILMRVLGRPVRPRAADRQGLPAPLLRVTSRLCRAAPHLGTMASGAPKASQATCFGDFVKVDRGKGFLAAVSGLGLAAAASVAFAGPPKDIDAEVQKLMAVGGTPGLALGVVEKGRTVLAKGYGVRALGTSDPVDSRALFQIGSTTKAFTSAARALLVEDGKLGWDDKVIDYLPEFHMHDPYVTREFTIRDLLTHRSGLGLAAMDQRERSIAQIGRAVRDDFLFQSEGAVP